jgi:flagellar basal body rod protein FlgG
MASMIEIYRSHEINQRMVKIFDEKLGKSVNEIGRL